ncbi:hypothetical protein JXB41_04415 [Candidatus Woesearchaeota archaeon]|nr:hypothetical protein [Candidatus Woesearchaeota archaeon]
MFIGKKSQIWYTDFILGLTIFLIALLIAVKYISDNYILPREDTSEMVIVAQSVSESLMTKGVPESWNEENVIRIGITDGDYVINNTKLTAFSNLTQSDYEYTRSLLGSHRFEYLIFFKDNYNNTMNLTSEYIGKPNITEYNIGSLDTEEIISIKRFIVLKQGEEENRTAQILEMNLYLWQ